MLRSFAATALVAASACCAPLLRHGLPSVDPRAEGIDTRVLAEIVAAAEREHSSALIVARSGKVVLERYWPSDQGPLVAMSATKSIAALAIGLLLEQKKLSSLDEPVATFFPAWKADPRKSRITLRHLMNHTSGLNPVRLKGWREADLAAHALASDLIAEPGTRFAYNNNAVDFLGTIVRKAAGWFLDDFLQAHLFGPLEISGVYWMKDAHGNPRAAGELFIHPLDLAKIGVVLAQGGRWRGRQIVPEAWITESIAQSQPFAPNCGLLWWREAHLRWILGESARAEWARVDGLRDAAERVRSLANRPFATREALLQALRESIGKAAYRELNVAFFSGKIPFFTVELAGPVVGFSARGWLGQYLVVFPEKKLVAVRMRAPTKADYGGGITRDAYPQFPLDVRRLVP
jgi:CubicO group peptidase (beta-lactamase class C family)